jgi:hypothetical protein
VLIKKPSDMRYSEVTPRHLYMNRRKFIAAAAAAAGAAAIARPVGRWLAPPPALADGQPLAAAVKSPFSTTEKENTFQDITHYRTSRTTTTTTNSAPISTSPRSSPPISRRARGPSASRASSPSRKNLTWTR